MSACPEANHVVCPNLLPLDLYLRKYLHALCVRKVFPVYEKIFYALTSSSAEVPVHSAHLCNVP